MPRTAPPLLLLLLLACGPDEPREEREEPEQYASALCEASANCGCFQAFPSADACEQEYRDRFDAVLLDFDLEFDRECFESVLEGEVLQECAESKFVEACTVLQGDKQAGESCSTRYLYVPPFQVDECEGDLKCVAGTCRDPTEFGPLVSEGTPCEKHCPSSQTLPLYCAPDKLCHAQVEQGEPCDAYNACRNVDLPFLYCAGLGAGMGVCSPQVSTGGACDPRDVQGCIVETPEGEFTGALGWCDPAQEICVDTKPSVCVYADHPHVQL